MFESIRKSYKFSTIFLINIFVCLRIDILEFIHYIYIINNKLNFPNFVSKYIDINIHTYIHTYRKKDKLKEWDDR